MLLSVGASIYIYMYFVQDGMKDLNPNLQRKTKETAYTTLSPIIMEVENGGLEDDFSFQRGHFPLP